MQSNITIAYMFRVRDQIYVIPRRFIKSLVAS
jgi:hypothetical protein